MNMGKPGSIMATDPSTMSHTPILPCVVCNAPDHEGYFDHNGSRLLCVVCPNQDRPDVQARIRQIREWKITDDFD